MTALDAFFNRNQPVSFAIKNSDMYPCYNLINILQFSGQIENYYYFSLFPLGYNANDSQGIIHLVAYISYCTVAIFIVQ